MFVRLSLSDFCITSSIIALVAAIPVIIPTAVDRNKPETTAALCDGSTIALIPTKTAVFPIPAPKPLM